MEKDQIAFFVTDILNTGATLYAVDDDVYFFGDLMVADDKASQVWGLVSDICNRYGPRDHLRRDIAAYLKGIERCADVDRRRKVLQWLDRSAASRT